MRPISFHNSPNHSKFGLDAAIPTSCGCHVVNLQLILNFSSVVGESLSTISGNKRNVVDLGWRRCERLGRRPAGTMAYRLGCRLACLKGGNGLLSKASDLCIVVLAAFSEDRHGLVNLR